MELWISGEIMADVDDAYGRASNLIQDAVNDCLRGKDYGVGLRKWAYIALVLDFEDDDYREVAKLWKKRGTAEFRLKIDHNTFLQGKHADHVRLISESLLRSLRMMPEIGVENVDFRRLTSDVAQCLTELQAGL